VIDSVLPPVLILKTLSPGSSTMAKGPSKSCSREETLTNLVLNSSLDISGCYGGRPVGSGWQLEKASWSLMMSRSAGVSEQPKTAQTELGLTHKPFQDKRLLFSLGTTRSLSNAQGRRATQSRLHSHACRLLFSRS
jgi:hypothetical protein